MSKLDSNAVSGFFIVEGALGVPEAGAPRVQLSPNSYGDFGNSTTTLARETINPSRQRLRGSVSDIEAVANHNSDLTFALSQPLVASLLYAPMREKPTTLSRDQFIRGFSGADGISDVVAGSGGTIEVTLVPTAPAWLIENVIVVIEDFNDSQRTTAPYVVSDVTGSVATLSPLGFDEPEPVINANSFVNLDEACLRYVGCRLPVDSTTEGDGTFNIIVGNADYVNFGLDQLTAGEWVFIGSEYNAFPDMDAGYARFAGVEDLGTFFGLRFDATTAAIPLASQTGTIDLFVGTFIRNQLNSEPQERTSFSYERHYTQIGQYERVLGCVSSEMSLSLTEKEKATADFGYMGLDSCKGDIVVDDHDTVYDANESAFNLSTDVYRARLAIQGNGLNPAALFAFAQSIELTVNNNLTVDGAIGVLGGFEITAGMLNVEASVTAYLASLESVCAIRNNEVLGIDVILAQERRGLVIDIPALTMSEGRVQVEKDQSVKLPLTAGAHQNKFGYTIGFTYFAGLPQVAMPTEGLCDC